MNVQNVFRTNQPRRIAGELGRLTSLSMDDCLMICWKSIVEAGNRPSRCRLSPRPQHVNRHGNDDDRTNNQVVPIGVDPQGD